MYQVEAIKDFETTNKLLATFLRYRGYHFQLKNGNTETPYILTFKFDTIPQYVLDEFNSDSKDVIVMKDIIGVREIVNNRIRDYRRKYKPGNNGN